MSIQEDNSIMPTEFAPDAHIESTFVCACEEWMRTACVSEGFFHEHEGRRYCVLHYPGKDKVEAFKVALQKKLAAQDFDFRGVWFPGPAEFRDFEFSTAPHFEDATFSANAFFGGAKFCNLAHFEGARFDDCAFFNGAKFKLAIFTAVIFCGGAHFTGASFSGNALFGSATFNKNAHFENVTFLKQANFGLATFNANAEFGRATFGGVALFLYATFASYVRFAGDKYHQVFGDRSYLDLQHVRIEKPERASFHTLKLRPHWFINVDTRKFEFVNVKWPQPPMLTAEIESLRSRQVSSSHRLLSISYRQLAVNAEENHRYSEAAEFRYGSMDVRRQEEGLGMTFWRLAWWYWLLSGYGERITRAAVCLLLILVLFAGLYTQVGFVRLADQTTKPPAMITMPDNVGTPLRFTQALVHSFEVSILQKPEPKPLTLTARLLVGLETVLGPLQAALLALAIRRKFMR